MQNIPTATFVTFFIYIAGMIFIGWLGYRATSNLSDYILGGRKIGSVVTALSAGASDMSGWILMALPGAVYVSGISAAWIAIGCFVGALLNWQFLAKRLRYYSEKYGNSLTIPEYLSNRFNDKNNILRLISGTAILIFFTLYCASGVIAGARLFESTFNMPYEIAIWAGAIATVLYVFLGGFLAISWTDTIQASIMLLALLITPIAMIYATGGFYEGIDIVANQNPNNLSFIKSVATVQIISFVGWGLGYFGQPHIIIRFMAAESVNTIPKAKYISMAWMGFCLLGSVTVAFFAIGFFALNPELKGAVTTNPERVFIEVSKIIFNPWVTGFILAAILAAIMSTLSCQLLICSSTLTEDIYKTFFRKDATQRELVWFSRLMVLAVSLIAIYIARDPNSGVLNVVSYAWAGFGAAFGPVMLLSVYWDRMTKNGALAGVFVGTATVLIWNHHHWFDLYELVPGFILSSLAIVVFSLCDKSASRTITS